MALIEYQREVGRVLDVDREMYVGYVSEGYQSGTRTIYETWIQNSKNNGSRTYKALINKKNSENMSNTDFKRYLRELEIDCNNLIKEYESEVEIPLKSLWDEKANLIAYQMLMDEYPEEEELENG